MMVVRNERKRIKECLDWHLPFVDEVAIIDQMSDDGTWEFLKEYFKDDKYAYVITQDKQWGYCEPSKQKAADLLTTDWILYADADEKFPIEFLKEMHLMTENPDYDGYTCNRNNIFHVKVFGDNVPIEPKWLDVQHPAKDSQLRLTRASCSVFPAFLHNRVRVMNEKGEKRLGKTHFAIDHFKDIQEQWEDESRYKLINKK